MFFFETFAFVIVFPLCWWLGGRIAQHQERAVPPHEREEGAEVIDLAAWRRRRDARRAREAAERSGGAHRSTGSESGRT